ncbi:hypothetical protein [Spiroplasma endosymbiont of Dactylopius coccus]
MFKFKWRKDKTIDNDINNNKIGNVDNVNNSINFKKINNSIVNFKNKTEVKNLIEELGNLQVKQYKTIKILQGCTYCSNSFNKKWLKLSELQNKCLKFTEKNIENSNNFHICNNWKKIKIDKIFLIQGLNFDKCEKHSNLNIFLFDLFIKMKYLREAISLLIKNNP